MSVHKQHHFYTRPGHLPVVHSPISDKPFQVMRVIICAGLVDRLDYINLIWYVGGDPSRLNTASKILFLFLFSEFCVTISLRQTSSFCFRRGMLASFLELVGSMILQFHYQSFPDWLTASSCEHWQLIKRSDICDYEKELCIQFYQFLRLVFNVLWLNCLLCSEPFIFHSFDKNQKKSKKDGSFLM